MKDIFVTFMEKVPKSRRKECVTMILPELNKILEIFNRASTCDDEEWLRELKLNYEAMSPEQRLVYLFRKEAVKTKDV